MADPAPMEEPPEMVAQTATPAQILERLEFLRMRYRMGDMNATSFNEVLKIFRFRDAGGGVWSPGAQTNTWYRWDGRRWVAGTPPERLQIPVMPLGIPVDPLGPGQQVGPTPTTRSVSARGTCAKCGAANPGKKFCTACGSRMTR